MLSKKIAGSFSLAMQMRSWLISLHQINTIYLPLMLKMGPKSGTKNTAGGEIITMVPYHPLIVGNKIYAEPKVFDLKTGKILSDKMPDRSGCNTMSASATALFYRDSYHGMWDLQQNKRYKWTGLRPGCSLSTISAGGIVLSPESSAGCYCSYPIQTSIAFVPKFVESTE